MKPTTEHWLNLAEYDLETARAMLQSGRYLYVTFMCHLTLEKALKGLIAEQQEEHPPRIHRLLRLAELAGVIDDMTDKQRNFLLRLDPLHIETRYPEDSAAVGRLLSASFCQSILSETEATFAWLRQKLN
jgi:HEPN domain-containing protein